jgi:hypothetical protein
MLLAQEMLTFNPVAGSFDIDKVAEAIAGIGFPFRDEINPARFVISSDAESRDIFKKERLANPKAPLPFVLLVTVHPNEIIVSPIDDDPNLRAVSQKFVEWLTNTYECEVFNEFGTDIATLPEPEASPPQTPAA